MRTEWKIFLFLNLFSTNINSLEGYLQMKCCGLQYDLKLKEKFQQFGLGEFYKIYLDKNKYQELYKQSLLMCSLFGNRRSRRTFLAGFKHIKSQLRSKITN